MKKKLKLTVSVLAVVFCTLLGCERKSREADGLFLVGESEENISGTEGSTAAEVKGQTAAEEEAGTASQAEVISAGQENVVLAGQPALADASAGTTDGEFKAADKSCVVHVCGAVNEPGVYIMEAGSRIYQAVEKAGGFSQDADENYLNQADLLSDGMKIYVPTREEVEESGKELAWKISGGSGIKEADEAGREDVGKESGALVNINTAGEAQLTTLPGVGSSKAKSIIAYREKNGAYQKIEDIMNVEGIKDGVFEKIKDCITV